MVYECYKKADERNCGFCYDEPICYVSDYMLALEKIWKEELSKSELLHCGDNFNYIFASIRIHALYLSKQRRITTH